MGGDDKSNYNSIKFFIIYVHSQQLQGQLQTQHTVDGGNQIKDKHNIKTRDKLQTSTRERKRIQTEKVEKKQDEEKYTTNILPRNYLTQNIRIMNKYY
jgi:hypothetical protein